MYFGLMPAWWSLRGAAMCGSRAATAFAAATAGAGRRNERLLDAQADPELLAARVTNRGPDQIEEVPLDPLAREVVRDGHGEDAVLETRAVHLAEPGGVGRVVQRFAEPGGNVVPEGVRRQLGLVLHACARSFFDPWECASIPAARSLLNEDFSACPHLPIPAICRDFVCLHTALHSCGKRAAGTRRRASFPRLLSSTDPVDNRSAKRSGYTRPRPASTPASSYETDLSAQRSQAEAQARLPGPHVDPCRSGDPQAAPGKGS